jgi:hypothetical protein
MRKREGHRRTADARGGFAANLRVKRIPGPVQADTLGQTHTSNRQTLTRDEGEAVGAPADLKGV